MKKTRKLLKATFVMFVMLTFTSTLFLTSCNHNPVKDEPGTEESQDSGDDESDSKDNDSDLDDSKDDDSNPDDSNSKGDKTNPDDSDSKDDDSNSDDSDLDDSKDDDSNSDDSEPDKDPESTVKIVLGEHNQVKFTYAKDEENNTLTFTAEDGYDSYEWMMVGSTKPLEQKTGKSITISLEDFTDSFSIMLMAAKNGIVYTTNMLVDVCPPVMVYIKNIDLVSSTETDVVFNVEIEKPVSKDFAKLVVREYQSPKTIAELKEGETNVTFTLKQESLNDKKGHVFELISVDNSGNESAPLLFGLEKCGDNLFTTQLKTMSNTLKSKEIVGFGAMYDYESDKDSPFYKDKDFYCIKISKDCTKFGKNAFPSINSVEPLSFDKDIELSPLSFPKDTVVLFPEMDCDNGDGTLYAQVVAIIGEETVEYILEINGEGYMKDCCTLEVSYPWEGYKDKIQMVHIGSGCKNITMEAFANYQKLGQILIDEASSLISIAAFAFSNTAIEEIEIPASVKYLGGFDYCDKLKKITFKPNCQLSEITGLSNTAIEEITIPASVETIRSGSFKNCTQLNKLTFEIPLKGLWIGDNAFAGTTLTKVTLPTSKNGDATIYKGNSFPEDCTVTGGKIQE